MAKITDNEFKAIVTIANTLDEQIEVLRDAKKKIIETHWITVQAFYDRKKRLWI